MFLYRPTKFLFCKIKTYLKNIKSWRRKIFFCKTAFWMIFYGIHMPIKRLTCWAYQNSHENNIFKILDGWTAAEFWQVNSYVDNNNDTYISTKGMGMVRNYIKMEMLIPIHLALNDSGSKYWHFILHTF